MHVTTLAFILVELFKYGTYELEAEPQERGQPGEWYTPSARQSLHVSLPELNGRWLRDGRWGKWKKHTSIVDLQADQRALYGLGATCRGYPAVWGPWGFRFRQFSVGRSFVRWGFVPGFVPRTQTVSRNFAITGLTPTPPL